MNVSNFSSSISILSYMDQDEISIKSYNYNKYNLYSPTFIVKNNTHNFDDISFINFIDTNDDISQDILRENENQLDIYKNMFNPIFETEKVFNSFDSLEDSNTNNVDNSNIIIEIKNININFEEKNENEINNFIIFNNGNYDIYSNNIINEALNDEANKKIKKVKKVKKTKKFFSVVPKKPKKKKKNIEFRKDNSDNIRKKVKGKFHKFLKNAINEKLKKAGSRYIFKALPQSFIIKMKKEKMKQILNLTMKDIFVKFNDEKNVNKKVLEYLEKHNDISEKSNFNKIKNMKYEQIFNEYLLSKEFKSGISNLKKEKESARYIKDYIIIAHNFIDFYKYDKKKKKNISSN